MVVSEFSNVLRAIYEWVFPPIPDAIRDALRQRQFQNVRGQVPMLLAVAAINVCFVIAVCVNAGLPFASYSWMTVLIFYCVVRIFVWRRKVKTEISPEEIPQILLISISVSVSIMTALGITSSITFIAGTFGQETMIPISLAFGSTAIAHCLYTLRPAAIGVLLTGILPVALSMIFAGDFRAGMLGAAMISVAVLMIRFVTEQYNQMIIGLFLEKKIRDLANSDPLTGLANRRAVMAALTTEEQRGQFAVALLDLNGFKAVNDNLGHHAGDILLREVARRLADAVAPGDLIGRLGGDEFIVLMRQIDGQNDVSVRTTAILAGLCMPLDVAGHTVPVAASLGYGLFGADGETIDTLLQNADKAMYAAKHQAKRGVKKASGHIELPAASAA